MLNEIQKLETGLTKNFRDTVCDLEKNLISIADGENIIAGTEDKPIVSDSEKIPIHNFFMDGVYIRRMTMYKGMTIIGAIH